MIGARYVLCVSFISFIDLIVFPFFGKKKKPKVIKPNLGEPHQNNHHVEDAIWHQEARNKHENKLIIIRYGSHAIRHFIFLSVRVHKLHLQIST